jgi:HD-like signal output (HDOD) protein
MTAMAKKKVLFVDDELNILDGLRRMLRSMRNDYDMQFVAGGREALELMGKDRFDVVVSDMRMPGMDGAELLQTIQLQYPHAIRIMLTGQADEQSILKTIGVVHQFLAKPCDPERLKSILLKVGALQDMLADGKLKDITSQLGNLPCLSSTYLQLQKAIAAPNPEIEKVAEIIEQDIAMTAKLMQLVNSSFFGIYTKVDNPARAVTLLGLDTIKVLFLGLELFSQVNVSLKDFQVERLWFHSLAVGKAAKAIAAGESSDKELLGNCQLAGTLHDVGKLILISSLPLQYQQVIDLAREQKITLTEAEQKVLGVRQGTVGAYLMGLWGFTSPIIEAICFHSTLENYPAGTFSPALAVHIANVAYYRNFPAEIVGRPPEFNMVELTRLGLQDKMATWAKTCALTMVEGF